MLLKADEKQEVPTDPTLLAMPFITPLIPLPSFPFHSTTVTAFHNTAGLAFHNAHTGHARLALLLAQLISQLLRSRLFCYGAKGSREKERSATDAELEPSWQGRPKCQCCYYYCCCCCCCCCCYCCYRIIPVFLSAKSLQWRTQLRPLRYSSSRAPHSLAYTPQSKMCDTRSLLSVLGKARPHGGQIHGRGRSRGCHGDFRQRGHTINPVYCPRFLRGCPYPSNAHLYIFTLTFTYTRARCGS
jgi:hypothetical protein